MQRIASEPYLAALALSLTVTLAIPAELDHPFGIQMGQSVKSLDHARGAADNSYDLRSVPRPHPLLSRYAVVATEQAGVCKITGYAPMAAAEKVDRALEVLRLHVSELLGEPRFLPGNRDPANTGIWLWVATPAPPGAPRRTLAEASLYRYQNPDGRRAAMLQFEFENRLSCEPKLPPNPFR